MLSVRLFVVEIRRRWPVDADMQPFCWSDHRPYLVFGNLPVNWTKLLKHFQNGFSSVFYVYVFGMSFYIIAGVALTFFRRYKRSDWRFCACAINVKSSICSEMTKHVWDKYYGLFVRMYITSQLIDLSQINTRQTSCEACFDSKRKSRNCRAP